MKCHHIEMFVSGARPRLSPQTMVFCSWDKLAEPRQVDQKNHTRITSGTSQRGTSSERTSLLNEHDWGLWGSLYDVCDEEKLPFHTFTGFSSNKESFIQIKQYVVNAMVGVRLILTKFLYLCTFISLCYCQNVSVERCLQCYIFPILTIWSRVWIYFSPPKNIANRKHLLE